MRKSFVSELHGEWSKFADECVVCRVDVTGILRLTRSPTPLASESGLSGDGMLFYAVCSKRVYYINGFAAGQALEAMMQTAALNDVGMPGLLCTSW